MRERAWQHISTAPQDDRWAWVRRRDGTEMISQFGRNTPLSWWMESGATHWAEATSAEIEAAFVLMLK